MKKGNIGMILVIVVLVLLAGGVFVFKGSTDKSSPQEKVVITEEAAMTAQSAGKILAGKTSFYREFSKSEYEKALAENKIIFLDFYASWCPICRGEEPEIIAGFNELSTEKIAGFRVNYNDPDTDEDEKKLAKEFDIPYQHTKVILVDGKEVLKDGDAWDKTKFLEEINKFSK